MGQGGWAAVASRLRPRPAAARKALLHPIVPKPGTLGTPVRAVYFSAPVRLGVLTTPRSGQAQRSRALTRFVAGTEFGGEIGGLPHLPKPGRCGPLGRYGAPGSIRTRFARIPCPQLQGHGAPGELLPRDRSARWLEGVASAGESGSIGVARGSLGLKPSVSPERVGCGRFAPPHPITPTAGALPPRHTNSGCVGGPGAGDPGFRPRPAAARKALLHPIVPKPGTLGAPVRAVYYGTHLTRRLDDASLRAGSAKSCPTRFAAGVEKADLRDSHVCQRRGRCGHPAFVQRRG